MTRIPAVPAHLLALGLLLSLGLLAGCAGSKNYSDEDWEKVKLGMSLEEVEKLLGPGEKIQQADMPEQSRHVQGDTFRRWKPNANKTAWVAFKDGKLVAKQEEKKGS